MGPTGVAWRSWSLSNGSCCSWPWRGCSGHRSPVDSLGFAAARGAAGVSDDAAAAAAAAVTPGRTRGTVAQRERDVDSWDLQESIGAPRRLAL